MNGKKIKTETKEDIKDTLKEIEKAKEDSKKILFL